MSYETLVVQPEGQIAVVTFNRPPMNPINQRLTEELDRLLTEIENDNGIRALILTGAGEKAFSAGADVAEFGEAFAEGRVKEAAMLRHRVFTRIERFPKPVIAAINGYAFGGGCELAMACHLRLIAEGASIGQPEINLGIIPGYGGTQRLPRLIGRARAFELLLLGDRVPARRAAEIGLVNTVCAGASLLEEAKALARRLAQQAPVAVKMIIDSVNRGLETDIEKALEIEADNVVLVSATEDAMEGVMAFLQKRPPEFKGR
ncbi:MAG: enoyl-CoA hydratase [Candidatus Abyssobacteria bacterium SURF_5]|uniref:Enoyl-CoA hydratase n=1 Tax=Abyssobacteria bacterium (strain SURF_5) TaxID=2093360 RepID=A0A3A4NMY3_ABYX5|nr:MAG: enoyl-CoA hydratase [Candidatus Abyssubacteria bacterium SURF_5]